MESVSVSEIMAHNRCQRAWYYQYVKRLSPKVRPPQLASGSAVHNTIACALMNLKEGGLKQSDLARYLSDLGLQYLTREFEHEPNRDALVEKFAPGVRRALGVAPAWLWEGEWHIEEDLTHQFESRLGTEIEVRGRSDLYRVTDDAVELVEVKTTDKEPLQYLLYSPQHRYYALMLGTLYPDRAIKFRYLCLSTRGTAPPEHMAWPFMRMQMEITRHELEYFAARTIAQRAVAVDALYEFCAGCSDWCDYHRLSAALVTGENLGEVIAENYTWRPRHS